MGHVRDWPATPRTGRRGDRRAQAYADYGYAVKNVYVTSTRAAELRLEGKETSAAYHETLAELARLNVERTATWESVLLLGHPGTIAAARTWHRRVWQVERFARGQRTDTDQWDAVHSDINADRDRFYAAARQDLGITTGDVPRGESWEAASS